MVSPCSINMSPLWGFGCLLYAVFYKHAAPLGLNATQFAARYRSWGRGYLARWVGEPNPYGCSFGCSRSNFRASRILVRHAAPLGLNAAEFAARYRSWGRGYLARWVGEPNPYGCSFGCSRSNFRASRILVGHAAPLGLNAAELAARYRSWGQRLPRPMGWGTQPLRMQLRLLTFQFSCLPYPGGTCRPSGAKCGRIGGAVSIVGERFPCPAGWGTQPLRMQLRLLTFQFSCLPYLGATCRPSGAKCDTIGGAVSIVGERFPRPTGWGTQPLRMQLRLLTFQFSCLPYPGATCRPSGAKCLTFPFPLSPFLPFLLLPPPRPLASLR